MRTVARFLLIGLVFGFFGFLYLLWQRERELDNAVWETNEGNV